MKILLVGNLGYVGAPAMAEFRHRFPDGELIGFDLGYFAHNLSDAPRLPELVLNRQVYGDVRNFPDALLDGVDAVVDLAAISNDPMGNLFEEVTLEVNQRAAVDLARKCKRQGVRHFVFASSCSVYGAGGDQAKKEGDSLNPLTAYARSKIGAEEELEALASKDFIVTSLRFATACGFTDRLRLDLVLNDFAASAVACGRIEILSDGKPWRPLIDARDMARALAWGATRDAASGGNFLTVNTGSDEWNTSIRQLADAMAAQLPGVVVTVNEKAAPDKRSYCVDFERFRLLAPQHQPIWSLQACIGDLLKRLRSMGFEDRQFRESRFIRLKTLTRLRSKGLLNENLEWVGPRQLA